MIPSINKVIQFIADVLVSSNSSNTMIGQDEEGRTRFVDKDRRISVTVGVTEINVRKFGNDGKLARQANIPFNLLSYDQKQRLIALMDTLDDVDMDLEELLNQIFID